MPEMNLHFFFRHPDLVNVPKGATPRIILFNYEYWPDCKMLISAQLMILAPGNLFSMVSSPTHSLYVNRARGRLESTHNRRAPSADSQFIHSINVSKFVPHPILSIQIRKNGDGVEGAVTNDRGSNVERGPPHQRLQEGIRQEQATSGMSP